VNEKCKACADKGFLHAFNADTVKHEIQRCDSCGMIVDDVAATKMHTATCECEWSTLSYSSIAKRQVRQKLTSRGSLYD
jgi:hypothetical protein